jgi:hypothetical protein
MKFQGKDYILAQAQNDGLSCDLCAFQHQESCHDVIAHTPACLASGAHWKAAEEAPRPAKTATPPEVARVLKLVQPDEMPGYYDPIEARRPAPKPMILPADPAERKGIPIGTGVLDYFPRALAEVARVSLSGNRQHFPEGTPLHWDKSKSTDHADCIPRHFIDRHTRDTDGQRHSAKLAWRALAMLEIELEQEASRGAV